MPSERFAPQTLRDFSSNVFRAAGLRADDADVVARDLVKANLRGLDSHGVSRMPMYVHRINKGLVNPAPKILVEDKTAAVALVDGDNGMGFLAAHNSMLPKSLGAGLPISGWVRFTPFRPSRRGSSR